MIDKKVIQVIMLPAASVVLSEEDYESIRESNDRLREALAENERVRAENDRLRQRCDALALLHYGPRPSLEPTPTTPTHADQT